MREIRLERFALSHTLFAIGAMALGLTAPTIAHSAAAEAPPIADAGIARTVAIGEVVMLDASASTDVDGGRLRYRWTLQAPEGSAAALSAPHAVRPVFTVDMLGDYVAELVVSDGKFDSTANQVRISTGNVAPVAQAGDDRVAATGEAILLDAAGSTDFNGDQMSFHWRVVQLPAGSRAGLSASRSAVTMFIADTPGDYVVELVASDGRLDSKAARVHISTADVEPLADAGDNVRVAAGDTIALDGSASADAGGDTLSYSWSLLHAPLASTATLDGADTATPTLPTDRPGLYIAQLLVSAGGDTAPDTVVIEAFPRLGTVGDSDGDGVDDDIDNCVETPNTDQRDTNGDGIGNICDPDLNNDGFVTNFADLNIFKAAFFSNPASPNWNPDADFNGDDSVNFLDLQIMGEFFFGPPGPIAIIFTNPDGGSWHEPTNWNLGMVPDQRHSVRINLSPGMVVEYSTGTTQIGGIRTTSELLISGGELIVRGDAKFDADVTLTGGELVDANILPPTGMASIILSEFDSFTLDGVSLGADLTLERGSNLNVENDLILNGTITLASDNNTTYLNLLGGGGTTFLIDGSGEIVFGGTATVDNRNVIRVFNDMNNLTIGGGITVRDDTSSGQIQHRFSNGTVTIAGSVEADLPDRRITVFGYPLDIDGTLQVSNDSILNATFGGSGGTISSSATLMATTGGELELFGPWVNEGTISATDATLDIGSDDTQMWDNNGTITITSSTVELGGNYTLADVGTFSGTGTVNLNGTFDNTGQTVDLGTAFPGTVLLGDGGTILNGTVNGTAVMLPEFLSFTLDGITLGADITVGRGSNLNVENDLTLNGTITLASDNNTTYLNLLGDGGTTFLIDGSGEIVFGGTATVDNRNVIRVFNSMNNLTIGGGITVRDDTSSGQIQHRFSNGTVTIAGSVEADLPDRRITVFGYPLDIDGTLQVSNDSILNATFGGSGGTISSSATLTATTGGELELFGPWVNEGTINVNGGTLDLGSDSLQMWDNNGTITIDNSTVELGGYYTLVDVGTLTGTGTVILNGTFDNTGQTVDLGTAFPGTVLLGDGGTILNGTVNGSAVVLPEFLSFTLDGITLGADLTVGRGSNLNVENNLTLNGTITLASDNNTTFLNVLGDGGTTFLIDGSGEIVFGGLATADNRNVIRVFNSMNNLTIGGGITIRDDTASGQIQHRFSNGTVTIAGSVEADLPDRRITVFGYPLEINGTLQVSNNSILNATFGGSGGTIASGATVTATTGGELELFGPWVNEAAISATNAVLDLGSNNAQMWDNNGTITITSSTVELGGNYTLADVGTFTGTGTVIFDGTFDNTGQTVDLGTAFPGTVQLGGGGTILGGTVNGTAVTLPEFLSFTLDGVTLGADLTVERGSNLNVENDLTVNGTLTLASDNNTTFLNVLGDGGTTFLIDGSGEIVFGGIATVDNRNVIRVFNSMNNLTIGGGITIRDDTASGQIQHRFSNGTVTIAGSVEADLPDRRITVFGYPLEINGTLQVSNNSILNATFGGSGGTIASGATVTATTGGELELFGPWVNEAAISATNAVLDLGSNNAQMWDNNGTITITSSTVELGGNYTLADVGTFTGTGTVIFDGTFDNTGQTVDLGTAFPGTVQLGGGGTILGGTVNGTAVTLPEFLSFTLDGVTLGADLTVERGSNLNVENDLTVNGTLTLASDNNTTFLNVLGDGGTTFLIDGSGEIVFGGIATVDNRNVIRVFNSTNNLDLDVALRSGTTGGEVQHRLSNGAIAIQGTVTSDAGRTVTLRGYPLTIEGTLEAGTGSIVNLGTNYTLASSASLDVEIGGTATSQFGRFTSTSGATLGGTLNIAVVNGFLPSLTETFEIMTFSSRSGTFATENGTTIGGGLFFLVNYNAGDVTLEVVN